MKWWTMLCRAIQDRWFMVESSDKTWSTGEGMANHFSILALRQHGNKFGELSSNLRIHRRTIQKRSSWPRVSGMITHLEPDILECKVKWALGSITTNKASGCDGIPFEVFQMVKDDAVKVLHSICQQIWKTQQWPQDWKRSVFITIPKKGNAKECSNYCTIALISHANKVILQTRLQQYELSDV